MRYFLLFIAIMWVLPVYGANENESVAAISYNPSRLGAYSHLKIAQKAQLSGIDSTNADVNVMSTGTVEITNSGQSCNSPAGVANCYTVTKVLSMAKRENCSEYSDLCSGSGAFNASLGTEANTVVQGKSSSSAYLLKSNLSDIATSDSFPTTNAGTTINMKGGSLTASGSSSVFVNQITGTLSNVKLDALSSGTIIVNDDKSIKVEGSSASFKLGDITITAPGGASSGSFSWQERHDHNGAKVKVLAFR